MLVTIGNWALSKADRAESDKLLPVRIVANRLRPDREGEEILPEAFNKATIESFVSDGILDWHHQSVLGKTPEERAAAIIGRPTDFAWEDGLPVVYGALTKAHPIVDQYIRPHLESNNRVFGGSVGGSIRKARNVWDEVRKAMKRVISAINWDHLAIAARSYVVSPGSEVTLVKALLVEDDIGSALHLGFADVQSFARNLERVFETDPTVLKALEIGAGTDIATLTGADALRAQTISVDEKKRKKKKAEALAENIVKAIADETIAASPEGLKLLLKSDGFTESEAENFVEGFFAKLPQIFPGEKP